VGFNVNYNQEHNCLIGNFEGDLDLENSKEYVKEVARKAKKNNCKRFLNDLRKANIKLSIVDLYYMPEMVILEELDRTWKRAVVVKENMEKVDFYETTAHNRGLRVKVFNDINKAIEWLKT
jgi:hypothetical protein